MQNSAPPPAQISLLGSLLLTKEGNAVRETRRKVLALLAYLVVESEQAHSREELTALLWPEMSQAEGRNNLRVTLAQLKRSLGDPSAIVATRKTIQFVQTPSYEIDFRQFESLINAVQGHGHQSIASCDRCLADLETAVSLYRGTFLTGLNLDDCDVFEEWVFVWRERLYLQVIDLLDKLAQTYLEQANYDRALIYTRRQLELDPLYDRAQKRTLRLLALQKNVQAALNQFERFKARLIAEMGIEPDQEMRQLIADIRADHLAPSRLTSASNNASATPRPAQGNLPENLTPFFGREPELEALSVKLNQPDYRLISLVGPGGIGKTRLSLEVARQNQARFAAGVFFIPLAPLTNATQIPDAIEKALGIQLQSPAQTLEEQLILYLAEKELLLVIDNIEHLLDGVDLLLNLLRHCPRLMVLTTSRRMLDVQAEDLFQLEGLPFPKNELETETADQFPAVRLFCNRAHRLLKTFRLSAENRSEVVTICRLTQGMPLALELAASWIRDMPLSALVASIKQGHAILQTSSRDVAPRHRSIQAVFEYSWQLLSAAERALLAALSLFRGGFTMLAISDVVGSTPIDLIRLCNHSLVRRLPGSGRYELHELTRQFAAEKLALASAKQTALEINHAVYYLSLLEQETGPLIHTDPIQTFKRLQTDFDNIRTAWEQALVHCLFSQLRNSLQGYVHYHIRLGRSRELIATLQHNHAYVARYWKIEETDLFRCWLLTFESFLLSRLKDKAAMDATQRALALAEQTAVSYLITFNYYIWGWALNGQGHMVKAIAMLDKAEQLARKHQFPDMAILIFRAKGNCHFVTKNYELATTCCETVVSLCQQHQLYPAVHVQALGELGNISSDLGYHEEGIAYLDHALAKQKSSGIPRDKAIILHYLACIQSKIGLNEAMIENENQAIALCEEIGDFNLKNWARLVLVAGLRRIGQPDKALAELENSLQDVDKYLFYRETGWIMLEMGNCFVALDQWAKAKAMYQQAIKALEQGQPENDLFIAKTSLAYAMLRANDLPGAYEIIAPLAQKLEMLDTSGWDDRLIPYLYCCLVLQAANDGRAEGLLIQGKAILDELISKIKSEEIRQAVIKDIPEHRMLLSLDFGYQAF
ncbi:MAG: BTAD domain-containing putative transcriptional regulator [Chloroflexota bacterium]